MSEAALQDDPADAPVWARDDAFPEAPSGWGWLDRKGRRHSCESAENLADAIREDRKAAIVLAWSPEHPRMRLPEEIPGIGDAIRTARDHWTREDLSNALDWLRRLSIVLAGLFLWTFFQGLLHAGRLAEQSGTSADLVDFIRIGLRAVLGSSTLGIALLAFLIFGFIPWYQARKRRMEMSSWSDEGIAMAIPAMRFETWLGNQRAPATLVLLFLIGIVWFAQILLPGNTVNAAGLMKDRYAAGEWWRLLTAPFLHANLVHLLMNGAALAYLGKRLEVFARWPHLPLVFLFSACLGGEASARLVAAPTIGASGGLMGLLGFLLVFETLHGRLVPRNARRRLVAGVVLTALIGLIGYRFIDNAAHAGGLVAGMIYAGIVFPKSSSPHRPGATTTDVIAGVAAMAVLVWAAFFTILKLTPP